MPTSPACRFPKHPDHWGRDRGKAEDERGEADDAKRSTAQQRPPAIGSTAARQPANPREKRHDAKTVTAGPPAPSPPQIDHAKGAAGSGGTRWVNPPSSR